MTTSPFATSRHLASPCSRTYPKRKFTERLKLNLLLNEIRAAFRLVRCALHLLSGLAMVAVIFPTLRSRGRLVLKARWSSQLLNMLGVRLQVGGTPVQSGLLVANHISWLDIFAINALAPTAFVAKDDVRRWPLIGRLSVLADTLFIERGSRSAAQRTREHLVERLRQGCLVGVFPEGTTGFGDKVLPFHGALFQAAIDAQVPVRPVVLHYADAADNPARAPAYVGETSFWECFRAIATTSGLKARVTFLSNIEVAANDRRHLAHHAHQVIARALAEQLMPNRAVLPAYGMATEIPFCPPVVPPSGVHPKGSQNPGPTGSPPA